MPLSFKTESIRRTLFSFTWWCKKSIITFTRRHLSTFLALLLVVLSIGREIAEHYGWPAEFDSWVHVVAGGYGLQFLPSFIAWIWRPFIFLLALLTVAAAIWEVKGNRLATTPQEVRFIAGTHKLLQEINLFGANLARANNKKEAELALQKFLSQLLIISSGVLCGKHSVDVSLMLYDQDQNALILDKNNLYQSDSSRKYRYPDYLLIPLGPKDEGQIGPAEAAFTRKEFIAHMPKKKNRIGLLYLRKEEEKYIFEDFFSGWYPSPDGSSTENFRSVLSVPVRTFLDNSQYEMLGVLNFTTRTRDLFVDRDYIMASCFASFAFETMAAYRQKLAELGVH